jgi:hypothetical protein
VLVGCELSIRHADARVVTFDPFAFDPRGPRLDVRRAPFNRECEWLGIGHTPQIEHDLLAKSAEQHLFPEEGHHVDFLISDGQLRERVTIRVRPPLVADTLFHTR